MFAGILIMLMTTAQKMKFSIKDFFSKCDQIHRKLWIPLHLLKKSLMGNFIFCAVDVFTNWHWFYSNNAWKLDILRNF